MTAAVDSEQLVDLLDRQFTFLAELEGAAKIIRLRRILGLIEGEPLLTGLLEDFRIEAGATVSRLEEADAAIRTRLGELWHLHREALIASLADVKDDAAFLHYRFETYEPALAGRRTLSLVEFDNQDDRRTERLVSAFVQWVKWSTGLAVNRGAPSPEGFDQVATELSRLASVREFVDGEIDQARQQPWTAYERLRTNVRRLNPEPPRTDDVQAWIEHEIAVQLAHDIGKADHDIELGMSADNDVKSIYFEISTDARIVHEELRLRIGVQRTRLAIVRRFAARCEAFDAARLRAACAADSRNAERILTLEFARYLFDTGVPPLIDATVANLRPDLLHLTQTQLFYVEAKQYDGAHPTRQVRKAYAQVWGTWGRLRNMYPTHDTSEAFLVVFRRDGRLVELPPIIRTEGLRLHSILIDIAEGAGSREEAPPIRFTAETLTPLAVADALEQDGA